MPIDARQLLAEAPARHDADPRVRVGEARCRGRDQDVAAERQLETAGDREAVDRADDRQRTRGHGVEQALVRAADGADDPRRAGRLAAQLLQVETGAEGAPGAGQDEHVDLAGPRQLDERLAEQLPQLARQRVQRLAGGSA